MTTAHSPSRFPSTRRRSWSAFVDQVRLGPRRVVVALLRLYQRVISPLYGPSCRFYPSCSQYALLAVQRHGVVRGSRLAAWRLLRCNPWNPGGVDDVPPGGEVVPPGEDAGPGGEVVPPGTGSAQVGNP